MDKNAAVVFDSSILYPARLKDLLIELSVLAHKHQLFRAKWTEQIHDEWISNLLKDRTDIAPAALLRTRQLMNKVVPDSIVTGYEHRIAALVLPDPDDRHVLAAAIECSATVIVTTNLRDFPAGQLSVCSVTAKHPDDFLLEFLEDNEQLGYDLLEQAVRCMKDRLKNPPYTWEQLFERLKANGLERTTTILRSTITRDAGN
jgi:predicted nucleic acid-binding protein